MAIKIDFYQEGLKELPEEDKYKIKEAIAKIQLANVRESKKCYETLKLLKEEYLKKRREIIGEKNYEKIKRFQKEDFNALRSLEEEIPRTKEEFEEILKKKAEIDEKFEKYSKSMGIDERKLIALRKSYSKKREQAILKTIGKGKKAEEPKGNPDNSETDPEFFPPYSGWNVGFYEREGNGIVRCWDNERDGTMGGHMQCSLHDCGEHDSQHGIYRQYWTMAGAAERTGCFLATIDLQPNTFFHSMMVRDNRGYSGVEINRHFKAFAQLAWPYETERYYWQSGRYEQIIRSERGVATVGGARRLIPFYYKEHGFRLDPYDTSGNIESMAYVYFTGTRITDGRWRYAMLLPDSRIEVGQPVLAAVGIEFYNSVWGNDCTVNSVLDFEFQTPRISWDIV